MLQAPHCQRDATGVHGENDDEDRAGVRPYRVRITSWTAYLPRADRASLPFELAPKRLDGSVCGAVRCYPGRYRTAHETNIPF